MVAGEHAADAGRQAVAQGAVAGGVQPATRRPAGEGVVAGVGQPGHVAADEGIVGQHGGNAVEDCLVHGLQRRMPAANGLAQVGHCFAGLGRVTVQRWQVLEQAGQGLPGITVQGDGTGVEVVELARVDVHAQQLAADRQALAPEVGVGHFGTHCQHHVGLADQLPAGLDAQAGAGIQWRARWQQALAGHAGEQWRCQPSAQLLQLLGRVQCPTTGNDHRPLGGGQLHGGLVEDVAARLATPGAAHHLIAPVTADRRGQYVQRHRDVHRARPFAVEHGPGTSDQLGQVVAAQGHGRERGNRRGHGALVLGFVQAAPALAQAGGVVDAGNHQHRHRVGIGLADGGGDVGHAWAGNDEAHPRLATDPRIAVGHEAGALLVAGQHMADAAARQAAVQLQGVHAGDAEYRLHAIVGQQAHQRLAGGRGVLIHVVLLAPGRGGSARRPRWCRGHRPSMGSHPAPAVARRFRRRSRPPRG
ncbi:hypothetical protein D3C75_675500 [compost metagenome]